MSLPLPAPAVPPPPLSEEVSGPLGILRVARWYLSDPNRWTRKAWARTDTRGFRHPSGAVDGGDPTTGTDLQAVCWCASGALSRATYDLGTSRTYRGLEPRVNHRNDDYSTAFYALSETVKQRYTKLDWGGPTVAQWNDDVVSSHDELLEVFDAAIAQLEDTLAQQGTFNPTVE